ncbi:uncharacterized protein LOC106665963 [Cimex lectularius]|uniref:F-box domain-containing protein n=1 Tax=Cimex lectularius TaxID=79782 RepID=A0A8I6RRL4_CIMLE|nr:uncharacterized protein LOC106665963 [Cimex lectularius]
MSDIGSNIINEYLILKRIFSHLLPKDLLSASLVCKDWHTVAKRVLQEFGGPLGYVWDPKENWPNFNRQILPKVILHFDIFNEGKINENTELITLETEKIIFKLKENYPLYYKFYTTSNRCFIGSNFSNKTHNKIDTKTGSELNALQSVLLLNDSPGCTIKTFEITSKSDLKKEVINKFQSRDIKGIILIGNFIPNFQNSMKTLFKGLERLNAPLAGGRCYSLFRVDDVSRIDNKETNELTNIEILGITFEGENVTTNSAVHKLKMDHDKFLKEFSEEVGPRPDNSTRIAFLFVCVDRIDIFSEEYEWKLLKKYFPNVPVYGFFCYGEYFLKGKENQTSPLPKKRKVYNQNPDAFYYQSTSYLIVTIKNHL